MSVNCLPSPPDGTGTSTLWGKRFSASRLKGCRCLAMLIPMIPDWEIWSSANTLIKQYGDGAVLHAAQRADVLLERGDMDGRRVWHRIEAAIRELQRPAEEGEVN